MQLLGPLEASRRLGVHPFTLRRWDESGVLKPDIREYSGRRLYREETIERFAKERAAKKSEVVA